jgi:hypothetical protein
LLQLSAGMAGSHGNTMKNNSLAIKALLAVIAAIAFLPVGPAAASIAFTVTGLLAVFLSDFSRDIEPIRAQAGVTAFDFAGRSALQLNKAA